MRAWPLLFLAACGGDAATAPDAGDDPVPVDADTSCPRVAPTGPHARKIVVSHPYTASSDPANVYRVLSLSADGALTATDTTFELGRSTLGEIVFTPDGEVGLVAQEDGSLGVFRFDDTGAPVVVHARFDGAFYAAKVVMSAGGDVAYVLDNQWRENGGGIYRVAIGCDGTLTDLGRWAPSKLPAALHVFGERAVVAAADWDASLPGEDAQLVAWGDPPARTAGADAFGDDDAIVAGTALTADARFFLVGDNSQFSGVANRIAVVQITDDALAPVQVLTPFEDPIALVASPFDDVVLALSGFGDAAFVIDRDDDAAQPFTVRGELDYVGASPQLPGAAVLAGDLALVAENVGVRRVRFEGGGTVTDLGLTALGDGVEAIVGTLGVTP
jgi:hypothetical protein